MTIVAQPRTLSARTEIRLSAVGHEIGLFHDSTWTEAVSSNLFQPHYELVENSTLGNDLAYDTARRAVVWDIPTGMIANIDVPIGSFPVAILDRLCTGWIAEKYGEQGNLNCYFFPTDSGTQPSFIFVGYPEPGEMSDHELSRYGVIVEQLRSRGRSIVADELIELLHDIQEDPDDDVELQMYSLHAMARFLIQNNEFADPLVGPDPDGLMQAEWRIFGDGLLVMAFLEDYNVHCVAQAEPSNSDDILNVSVELPMEQAAKEYGYLIPLR